MTSSSTTTLSSSSFSECTILYSTQSGRARACARRCARLLAEQTAVRVTARSTFDDAFCRDTPLAHLQQPTTAASMSNAPTNTNKKFWLLLVSTMGDGEHTDTIQQTWRALLTQSLPRNTTLQGTHFAIFSLGDRAYGPLFCAAGRKLAVRLLQLGAQLLASPGYGDDGTARGGVLADLDDWWDQQLRPVLSTNGNLAVKQPSQQACPYRVQAAVVPQEASSLDECDRFRSAYQSFFRAVGPRRCYHYSDDDDENNNNNNTPIVVVQTAAATRAPPLTATVIRNERLTAPDWDQDTRHVALAVPAWHKSKPWSRTALPYQAGDVAYILPSNPPHQVQRFLDVLPPNLAAQADRVLTVSSIPNDDANSLLNYFPHWPTQCTLRGWLTYCADICGLPEREDLRALAQYCNPSLSSSTTSDAASAQQQQRDKLVALSETAGSALYADYILREKRNWADVLYDFDALRGPDSSLTLPVLWGLVGPLRPRAFSLASAPTEGWLEQQQQRDDNNHKDWTLELCVAVVQGRTPLGRSYHGLCSNYLANAKARSDHHETQHHAAIRLWIQPGSFQQLPQSPSTPVLCIGAGTGVAPLRGLLRERAALRQLVKSDDDPPTTDTLVFGCRKQACDYYYRDEWDSMVMTVHTAFSQDQWHKIYVQQVLKPDWIARHVVGGAAIYIAGNPRMAKAVKQVVAEAVAAATGMTNERQVKQLLTQRQQRGLYNVEAWG